MEKTARTWFITGASTGFGRLLAEELLKRGERVAATARDRTKVQDLETQYPGTARAFTLDVTEPAQIEEAARQAIADFGRIDVLVNNAGYGVNGAIEEVSDEEFEPMFQTNIYGLIRTTRAFLPHFRQQRSGHIFNFSSIGGLIGTAGWGFYNTTKFAVEGFSEALAAEMKPLGVRVTVIEPGPFRTDFLGRSGKLAKRELPEYAETAGKAREYLRTRSRQATWRSAKGHRGGDCGSRFSQSSAPPDPWQDRPHPVSRQAFAVAEGDCRVGECYDRSRLSRERLSANARNGASRSGLLSAHLFTTEAGLAPALFSIQNSL